MQRVYNAGLLSVLTFAECIRLSPARVLRGAKWEGLDCAGPA